MRMPLRVALPESELTSRSARGSTTASVSCPALRAARCSATVPSRALRSSKGARQIGTSEGWTVHAPSKPCLASRALSRCTRAWVIATESSKGPIGASATGPPIACTPRRWQARRIESV